MIELPTLDLTVDGRTWAPDKAHFALPVDRKVGTHHRQVAWGAREKHPFFPYGAWLPGASLKDGDYLRDFDVRGVAVPCETMTVLPHEEPALRADYRIATGHVLGALLSYGKMRCVYVVLYLNEGEWTPREAARPADRATIAY